MLHKQFNIIYLFSILAILIGLLILLGLAPLTDPYEFILLRPLECLNQIQLFPTLTDTLVFTKSQIDLSLVVLLFAATFIPKYSREFLRAVITHSSYGTRFILGTAGLFILLALAQQFDSTVSSYQLVLGTVSVTLILIGSAHLSPWIKPLTKIFNDWGKRVLNSKSLSLCLAIMFGLSALTISWLAFAFIPYNPDSSAELFHAKILASGSFYAPAPTLSASFKHHIFVDVGGRWLSPYPFGHLIALTIGTLFGITPLVSPLLGALTIILVYLSMCKLYDELTARATILLMACSPFFLLYSSEYLNHSTALFYFSLFLWGFSLIINSNKYWQGAAISGIGLVLLVNTRPLTALGLILPFVGYSLGVFIKSKKLRLPLLFLAKLGIVALALFCIFNYLTTGNWLLTGYELYGGAAHHPGLGIDPYGHKHTIGRALGNNLEQLIMLNRHLFGWPLPSLTFIVLLISLKKTRGINLLFLTSALGLWIAYGFFWYYENFYGPRYLFESLPLLAVLTARGIIESYHLLLRRIEFSMLNQQVAVLILLCVGYALTANFRGDLLRKRKHWQPAAAPVSAIKKSGIKEGLFLITGNYHAAFSYNTPYLNNGLIFARSSYQNNDLIKKFFELPVYNVTGSNIVKIKSD
jgi:Dolichyl-phosphate-mannose-protein mannosyltransferase